MVVGAETARSHCRNDGRRSRRPTTTGQALDRVPCQCKSGQMCKRGNACYSLRIQTRRVRVIQHSTHLHVSVLSTVLNPQNLCPPRALVDFSLSRLTTTLSSKGVEGRCYSIRHLPGSPCGRLINGGCYRLPFWSRLPPGSAIRFTLHGA